MVYSTWYMKIRILQTVVSGIPFVLDPNSGTDERDPGPYVQALPRRSYINTWALKGLTYQHFGTCTAGLQKQSPL